MKPKLIFVALMQNLKRHVTLSNLSSPWNIVVAATCYRDVLSKDREAAHSWWEVDGDKYRVFLKENMLVCKRLGIGAEVQFPGGQQP